MYNKFKCKHNFQKYIQVHTPSMYKNLKENYDRASQAKKKMMLIG